MELGREELLAGVTVRAVESSAASRLRSVSSKWRLKCVELPRPRGVLVTISQPHVQDVQLFLGFFRTEKN